MPRALCPRTRAPATTGPPYSRAVARARAPRPHAPAQDDRRSSVQQPRRLPLPPGPSEHLSETDPRAWRSSGGGASQARRRRSQSDGSSSASSLDACAGRRHVQRHDAPDGGDAERRDADVQQLLATVRGHRRRPRVVRHPLPVRGHGVREDRAAGRPLGQPTRLPLTRTRPGAVGRQGAPEDRRDGAATSGRSTTSVELRASTTPRSSRPSTVARKDAEPHAAAISRPGPVNIAAAEADRDNRGRISGLPDRLASAPDRSAASRHKEHSFG